MDATGIDALAVCVGNVHGKYPASGPNLRLDLLKVKYSNSSSLPAFLLFHIEEIFQILVVQFCINMFWLLQPSIVSVLMTLYYLMFNLRN